MRRYFYWLFPFIWMGIIFFASSQPYEKQNIQPILTDHMDLSFIEPYISWISFTFNDTIISVESLGFAGFLEFFIRKATHIFVFFVLTCLIYFALKQLTNISFNMRLMLSFTCSVSYAFIDEYHQGFTMNRTSYIGDVFLDAFGALLAIWLFICIRFYQNRQST